MAKDAAKVAICRGTGSQWKGKIYGG
ncbi:uncharacterized protein G2W53_016261 [Senna tora]|uniref:Uncharacterized protein n=1 Tax=Senna tora TaxID=362788 RepID=A0A834WJE8_9FABA|nr:uncharacterized protein G2W53_016261 [Senna tora]